MALYYYNKYSLISTPIYIMGSFLDYGNGNVVFRDQYKGYTFNKYNNTWTLSGDTWEIGDTVAVGSVLYQWYKDSGGELLWRWVAKEATTVGTKGISARKYTAHSIHSTTSVEYSRGVYISQEIAENGTYPTNGKSGSYWYVRSSAVSLPTTPSSITVPTPVKGGEPITISWGASSNTTSYQLERSLNGGVYVEIYSGANLNYVNTVPKGSLTVQYRVKATGVGGVSSYQTGSLITVINFPEIYENFNGVNVAYEVGWENVNGTWVEIDSVWENVNGVWIEL